MPSLKEAYDWIEQLLAEWQGKKSEYELLGLIMKRYGVTSQTANRWLAEVRTYTIKASGA